jgi:hypothetical protein
MDAETGQIVVAALTTNDVDDGSQVGPLLDQVAAPVASVTADGTYDQEGVAAAVAARHLQCIAEHGRAAWQKVSGYNIRARVKATIGRFKQVIGDGLRSRTDQRRATEVGVAVLR